MSLLSKLFKKQEPKTQEKVEEMPDALEQAATANKLLLASVDELNKRLENAKEKNEGLQIKFREHSRKVQLARDNSLRLTGIDPDIYDELNKKGIR